MFCHLGTVYIWILKLKDPLHVSADICPHYLKVAGMWLRLWKLMETKSLTVYALCTFSHQPTLISLYSGSLSWLHDPSLTSGLCLWLMLSARLGVAHFTRTQRKGFWPLETVVDLCSWSLLIYCGNYCRKNYCHQRKSLAFTGFWVHLLAAQTSTLWKLWFDEIYQPVTALPRVVYMLVLWIKAGISQPSVE